MRNTLQFLSVLFLLACAAVTPAWAKRLPPPNVPPVVIAGVRYTAPNDDGTWGHVQATDAKTGRKLWDANVYRVTVNPDLEEDVQDVFITRLEANTGHLLITDEKARHFSLDPKTHLVVQVLINPATPTPAPASPAAPTYRMSLIWIAYASIGTDEYLFVINDAVGYRSVAALEKAIAALPPGTTLRWAPSDKRNGHEPLLSSDGALADFKTFCAAHQVNLVLVPAG